LEDVTLTAWVSYLKIINKTKIPTKDIRQIIEFVWPPKLTPPAKFKIEICTSRKAWNNCYTLFTYVVEDNSTEAVWQKEYIRVGINCASKFPIWPYRLENDKKIRMNFILKNKYELLVEVLAHEMYHALQHQKFRGNKDKLVKSVGKYKKIKERGALEYAYRKLQEWRIINKNKKMLDNRGIIR
jgi:hypothetical protein